MTMGLHLVLYFITQLRYLTSCPQWVEISTQLLKIILEIPMQIPSLL